jgi:hypothetical protein
MKRYRLTELIEGKVFGFEKQKKVDDFKPLELVESITYTVEDDGLLYLHSNTYHESFKKEYFEPVRRVFKGVSMYLGSKPPKKKRGAGHLLIFQLGQGYYALLTPFNKTKSESK